MSIRAEDFVTLFYQRGLGHLTQEIMLMLVSPEEEDCGMSEAKLVSCMWREAVDNLVLNTDLGKHLYLQRITQVLRRAVSGLEKRASAMSAKELERTYDCLPSVVIFLRWLEEPETDLNNIHGQVMDYEMDHSLAITLHRDPPLRYCHAIVDGYRLNNLGVVDGYRLNNLGDLTCFQGRYGWYYGERALAWKKTILKTPVEEEQIDDWKRALRALFIRHLLYSLPRDINGRGPPSRVKP